MKLLARSSLYGGLAGLGTSFASFFSTVVLARILGADGLGEVSYAVWAAFFAAAVADIGLTAVLQRYLPELRVRGQASETGALARACGWAGLVGCGAVFAFFAMLGQLAPAADPAVQHIPWIVVGLLAIGVLVSTLVAGLLTGLQQFGLLAVLSLALLVVQPVAVGIGGYLAGPLGATLGQACSLLLLIVGLTAAPRTSGRLSLALRSRVVRYGLLGWATTLVAAIVWGRFEILFLKAFTLPEDIGLFTVALAYSQLIGNAPLLFMRGLLPHFAQRASTEARHNIEMQYQTTQRVTALVVYPMCLGGAVISEPLMTLIYGPSFAGATTSAAVMLAASALVVPIYTAQNPVLLAYERVDFQLHSGLAGAVAMVLACLVLVPAYGLIGAVTARAVVQVGLAIASSWFLNKRLAIRVPYGDLARLLAASVTCAIAAHLTLYVFSRPVAPWLSIVVGASCYFAILRTFSVLPEGDAARLAQMAGSLPRPIGPWMRRAVCLFLRAKTPHGGLEPLKLL